MLEKRSRPGQTKNSEEPINVYRPKVSRSGWLVAQENPMGKVPFDVIRGQHKHSFAELLYYS